MNKIYLIILLFFSTLSFSQHKFERGSYISTTKGQDIKLNLKENNQYELVVIYGDYEIKNDTLKLGTKNAQGNDFSVAFSSDSNPALGKVKVKLIGNSVLYYGIYLGTQSGNTEPSFKAISELIGNNEYDKTESEFEINRSDFFYLVKEDFNGESTLQKYTLPKSANEIQIQYAPNYLGSIQLQGFLNEKNELVVSDKNNKNLLVFVEESKKPKALASQINPLETTKKQNWTYAGKEDPYDYFGAVDSMATPATSYKLIVQDNLQKAIEITKKTPSKYLVISYDPDNKNAKSEFNEFIKNQEYAIGTYISYEYGQSAEYDRYNYYAASVKDKSWATKNKIADNPSTIILDSDGNILSQTKGNITANESLFEIYSTSVFENLQVAKTMIDLNKSLNSKAKDAIILQKLLPLSNTLGSLWSLYPPVATTSEDYTVVQEASDETAVDTVAAYPYYSANETVYTKINFDKKKLLFAWETLVKNHSKDSAPNMDFVTVALAEIQGKGFYKQIFNEERIYDGTNFKAIDYLLKHYDAILEKQNEISGQGNALDYYGDYPQNIATELPNAISNNILQFGEQASLEYQNKILEVYKKVLEKQADDYKSKIDYFRLLNSFQSTEKTYVEEYDAFFNTIFKGSKNEIEVLDDVFTKNYNGLDYNDWATLKNSFSNASNEAAWYVVEKSKDAESIKKAIKWSESSLRIEKNNPYYLDTLAQLYYKNGEKQKAISTQEQALKFSEIMGEETKSDLETVLEKMKNGTY